jgi:hypothetical protein
MAAVAAVEKQHVQRCIAGDWVAWVFPQVQLVVLGQ